MCLRPFLGRGAGPGHECGAPGPGPSAPSPVTSTPLPLTFQKAVETHPLLEMFLAPSSHLFTRLVLQHLVSWWPQKGQSLGSQAVVILWGHLINVPSRWGLCLSCSLSASGIGARSVAHSLIHLLVHSFIPRVLLSPCRVPGPSHCQSEEAALQTTQAMSSVNQLHKRVQ